MSNKFNPIFGTKVVIIGGSSGLGNLSSLLGCLNSCSHTSHAGYSAAEISLDRGAIVFIASSSQGKVDAAVATLRQAYPKGQVTGSTLDIKDDSSVKAFFAKINETGSKGIDHLIYSAGDALAQMTPAQFEKATISAAFDVRVFGIFSAISAAHPFMNVGSSITLTTGSAAFKPPGGGWSVIGALTGAIVSLAKSLAIELAPIRVNSLAPGAVETPLWDPMGADAKAAMFESMKKSHLTGGVGQPEDIAHAYLFAMSCRFLTGQCIIIDGGALLI
ncbi:hypothetical protein P7C70_g4641, partial [Phenoliferia sp. Uapishka_3]